MSTEQPQHVEAAIIGAGLSGLGMAAALKADGCQEFVVIERADDLGGTWRDNTYPGCACDIPSILYSFTDDQNPAWSRIFASQPEIWDYMRTVARDHHLAPHLRFGHELRSARWDVARQRWELETSGADFTADVMISAAGALADAAIPALPGLDRFGGHVFHSARWDHGHDLSGRSVAVVGTGASAVQFVPEIQPSVDRLHLFQRTPPWILPRANPRIPPRWQRRLARHPRLMNAVRRTVFSLLEAFHIGFRHPAIMRLAERRARGHIARQVADPALREKLTPRYRLGCKRVLGSNTWYPALCAGNVDIVTAGISEVTADGIVDRDGVEHHVDTIIFGTGFQVTDLPSATAFTAPGDRPWPSAGTVALRPTSGRRRRFSEHVSAAGAEHRAGAQLRAADDRSADRVPPPALAHRRRQGLATLEPTAEAQARFVAEVDSGSQGSVWTAGGCLSWYTDDTGRNSTLWPGSVSAYQRRLAQFDAHDFVTALPRTEPSRQPALV